MWRHGGGVTVRPSTSGGPGGRQDRKAATASWPSSGLYVKRRSCVALSRAAFARFLCAGADPAEVAQWARTDGVEYRIFVLGPGEGEMLVHPASEAFLVLRDQGDAVGPGGAVALGGQEQAGQSPAQGGPTGRPLMLCYR